MNVQVSLTVLCSVLMLIIAYLTFKTNREKDAKNEATDNAVIRAKLDNISAGVEAIRVDTKANDRRLGEAEKTLIRMDESLKSAHKRIDTLEIKKGVDKDE